MNDILDDILCGGLSNNESSSKRYVNPVNQELVPTTTFLPKLSGPLAVMGLHKLPVILEDPVRFRKDIQTMVMAQMLNGYPDDDQLQEIKEKGSMIEIATVAQMVKAADGNLDSYKYITDRVLGKPVNQTKSVNLTVTYEQLLDQVNPDEVIEPKQVFCEEV